VVCANPSKYGMNASLLLWLLLATSVFWAMGVYNRLMRLRARGWDALGSVDKYLVQLLDLACKRFGVLDVVAARAASQQGESIPPEWAALVECLVVLDESLRNARAQPLKPDAMQALATAADRLQREWQRLNDGPADLAGAAVPEDMREAWEEIADKCRGARNGLNQILVSYDEAITQFPARLLAGFMGFESTGRL
jgi:LemA protein